MPDRAKSECREPGCSTLVDGLGYCAKHDRGTLAEQRRRYDIARSEDPIRKMYNSTWRRTSKWVIASEPVCQECNHAPSSVCDHIIAARKWMAAGHDFYDLVNLQALCKSCHDKKTAVECGFAGAHE